MALSSQATSVGSAIASALAALPKGVDQSEQVWQIACQKIFDAIVANAKATIPPSAIVTTGGPATQSGPAAPVLLSIT